MSTRNLVQKRKKGEDARLPGATPWRWSFWDGFVLEGQDLGSWGQFSIPFPDSALLAVPPCALTAWRTIRSFLQRHQQQVSGEELAKRWSKERKPGAECFLWSEHFPNQSQARMQNGKFVGSSKSASLGYGGALNDDGVFSTASALVFVLLNLQFLLGKKHFWNLEVDLQHVVNLYQRMLWMDCSRLCGTKAPQCKIARHGLTLQSQWLSALHSITQLQSLKVTTVLWCSYVLTLARAIILDAGSSL